MIVNSTAIKRRGAAVVEVAVVSPIIIIIFLGTLEMGRALHVKYTLQEAARASCRIAVLEGSTQQDLDQIANGSLQPAKIGKYTMTVTPTDFQAAEEGDPITVSISANFSEVSWFAPDFLNDNLVGSCTMRAMRRPAVDYPPPGTDPAKKGAKKVAKKVGKKESKKVGKKANKKQQALSWKKS